MATRPGSVAVLQAAAWLTEAPKTAAVHPDTAVQGEGPTAVSAAAIRPGPALQPAQHRKQQASSMACKELVNGTSVGLAGMLACSLAGLLQHYHACPLASPCQNSSVHMGAAPLA